jgi:hypothetical protein
VKRPMRSNVILSVLAKDLGHLVARADASEYLSMTARTFAAV